MTLPDDPRALVVQDLDAESSSEYERRTVHELRTELLRDRGGLLKVDAVDFVGSRPDTLVVTRYHHREQFVGQLLALTPVLSQRAPGSGTSRSIRTTNTPRA